MPCEVLSWVQMSDQPKAHLFDSHAVIQHPPMPHLSGGWNILPKEKCSVKHIFKHLCSIFQRFKPFVCTEKYLIFEFSSWKIPKSQNRKPKCWVYILYYWFDLNFMKAFKVQPGVCVFVSVCLWSYSGLFLNCMDILLVLFKRYCRYFNESLICAFPNLNNLHFQD